MSEQSLTPTAPTMIDVFAAAGAPSCFFSGADLQKRYSISPATFWRWRQPDCPHKLPDPRFGDGKSARWALEDIVQWENAKQQSHEA
ncbi:hypothetical protein DN730_09685 [Marinomonas piezotolerans]|uniref:DNA-binding protein n=1 Tax=Marinomonas piezotolerans TaxID=2213058 RepID=A0A370UA26_9GAMM|nr:hypothetical protein [Marinomonas piezotolerans]RDL44646.1 hypothetical protein DN730_09685 [Marinomonas piezotolerans]